MKPSCILHYGFFYHREHRDHREIGLETLDAIGEPSDIEIDQKPRLDLCAANNPGPDAMWTSNAQSMTFPVNGSLFISSVLSVFSAVSI